MITSNKYKKHISENSSFIEINSLLLIKNAVSVQFNVGSIHDPKTKEGVAHFLEHLILQVNNKDRAYINREKKGLYINGFTEKERTIYVASSYILSAEEIIKELLKSLNFDLKKNALKIELETISSEILESKSDPVNQNFNKALNECVKKFMNLNPYNHDILGTEKSIKNITIQDVKKHIDTYYLNPIISVTSSVALDKNSIESIFSHIKNKGLKFKEEKLEVVESTDPLESTTFEFVNKNTQVFGICLNNSNRENEDLYLSVLKGYLAYNSSSVCNQKMRFDKQLTYFVNNFCQIFNNFSFLFIQYDVLKKNKEKAKKEYYKIANELGRGKVDRDIFYASKSMLLSHLRDLLTDGENMLDDFMDFNQNMNIIRRKNGDFYTIDKFIDSVEKLTMEDFTEYIKKIFKQDGVPFRAE